MAKIRRDFVVKLLILILHHTTGASGFASHSDSMASGKTAVVIVDPVTDWRHVLDTCNSLVGHRVIAVQMPDVALSEKFKSFQPTSEALIEQGVSHVVQMYQRDVFSTTRQLQLIAKDENLVLKGVIPLSEVAVEVVDLIASTLDLPHNRLDLATARRDKGLMKDAVSAHGLRVAKHARVDSLKSTVDTMLELSLDYPIVLKTPSGMSTSDVFICMDEQDATAALEAIVQSLGPDGRFETQALLEEYLVGTAFAVNLMAFEGRVAVTDMWVYRKTASARYQSADVCNPDDFPELVAYALRVVRAVGIRVGAAHVELKAKKDLDGRYVDPALIEVGARLSGGRKSEMARAAVAGWDPFAALVNSHCGLSWPDETVSLTPRCFVRHVFLPIERAGRISSITLDTDVATLHSSAMMVKIGDRVAVTTDIVSCAGFIWLIGDKDDVDKDTEYLLDSFELAFD